MSSAPEGMLLVDKTHPVDVPLLGEALLKGLRDKRPSSLELQLRSAEDKFEPFWVRAAFPPASPSPVRIFAICMPLGDRQRRESQTHEERRLDHCSGAIVHRGVGNLEAGELTDQGLKLEDDLQCPLGDLGLIGSV